MTSAAARLQNVNIVSNNYSRYGTSVYDKLYHNNINYNNGGKNAGTAAKLPSISQKSRNKHRHGSNGSKSTSQSPISTFKSPLSSQNQVSGPDDLSSIGQRRSDDVASLDNETIVTMNSRKSRIKKKYKSLISTSSKKFMNKLYDHGASSDSFSIFSLKTSHSGKHENSRFEKLRKRKYHVWGKFADINDLPVEIIAKILSELELGHDQKTLVRCLYVSKNFYQATKIVLYKQPYFTSTYRVAQFVTSIRLHPDNGAYVKVLDLSHLKPGLIGQDSKVSLGLDEDGRSRRHRRHRGRSTNASLSLPPATPTSTISNDDDLNNISVKDDISSTSEFEDLALAGWRDWRYRNEPLYSSPLLNSFKLKKVVSRSSSITSTSSGNSTGVHSTRRQRSNSSVASITTSIMSSIYNTSHVSLSSTTSNTSNGNMSSGSNLSRVSTAGSLKKTPANSARTSPQKAKPISDITSSSWFRMKLSSRNRKARTAGTVDLKHPKSKPVDDSKSNGKNSKHSSSCRPSRLTFSIEQPFSTHHPYANKFLLKYAPYKDLPLGYILHMLNSCPNLVELNLSNLVICADFKLINQKSERRRMTSSLLPAVQESSISAGPEQDLEVVYITDSGKGYEYYEGLNKKHSRSSSLGTNPSSWIGGQANWGNYPPPIDAQTKTREEHRRSNTLYQNKNVELQKLNPFEIFEIICKRNEGNRGYSALTKVKMNDIVWCRQYMVKYFVLKTFCQHLNYKSMSNNSYEQHIFSFRDSGLDRNFSWACNARLPEFVALMVMDQLSKLDDLGLEELFNIKSEKLYVKNYCARDPDILEISDLFDMKYGTGSESDATSDFSPKTESLQFRLTILKTGKPTSFWLSKVSKNYVSLVVKLCINENVDMSKAKVGKPTLRIDSITHNLISRLKELRRVDLRRNVGENNYYAESIM
ncbi:hypothetical protein SKDZ_02G3090 [Saccharomyces kudriavzevii ZP591]|nr:hypothetical protein SKDZ_02G3090 [Saccharomyces kudriavzevii ZP591]